MEKGNIIGQGRTAEIYEWGTDKVLKLFKVGISKESVKSEYEMSIKINKQLNLTPKVYEVVEIDNRTGIIYEKINGISMLNIISSKPWRVKKEAKRLAELHKSIQIEIDFNLPSYKEELKIMISRTDLLSKDIKERLFDYIDKLKEDNVLCHGDFHPDNILITGNESIIIDWMTAVKGSPLADVARTSIMFKFGSISEKSYLEKKIINFIRKKFYLEYINHYINKSGVNIEQIQQWELPVAAARLIEWLPESEKKDLLCFVNMKVKELM